MATDEVQIILRGSSKQLDAALLRVERGLKRINTQSKATNASIQSGARKSAKSIDTQNRSFTLMVAKLALVTFAVQTLANIIDSTFGQLLRNIDEFQVAAIGTAAAVTSISLAAEGGLGEAFTQNLQAALATFEELEIVAAEFFATGQELQLAFNTLAQRGVVVREDEFRILGKLTDQIKLLTGGQNVQIQIQQELRAILDGNVRTTTAFAKSLQARGVDVAQLSKEVRATGSLKPFEPFLKGLEAAGPAIRRTLSSVTATFGSLFKILQRNIFKDTFEGVVSSITEINNLIIDQRDTIIQVGIFIKDTISKRWDEVSRVVDRVSATILRIVQNDMVQFGTAIVIISKLLKRGPLSIFLAISGAIVGVTGEVGTVGNAVNIFTNLFAIGIELLLKGLDKVVRVFRQLFEQFNAFTAGGFDLRKQISNIQDTEDEILSLREVLETLARTTSTEELFALGDKRTEQQNKQLQQELQKILNITTLLNEETAKLRELEANTIRSSAAGKEFIESRASGLNTLRQQVISFVQKLSDASDKAAGALLPDTKDELDKLLDRLKAAASGTGIPARNKGEFTETDEIFDDDPRVSDARRKAAIQVDEARFKAASDRRKRALNEELANVDLLAAKEELTGREAFDREQALRKTASDNEIAFLEEQVELVGRRAKLDKELIEANRVKKDGVPLTEVELTLKLIKLEADEFKKIQALSKLIADLRTKSSTTELNAVTKTRIETEKTRRLLEQRGRDLEQFGGATNSQIIAQINADSATAQRAFNKKNTSATEQDIFAGQQTQIRVNKAIEPQIKAIGKAIDDTFQTLIDGMVEGSFEFRDLAQSISKDFIKAGLQGFINEIKNGVTKGITSIFEAIGKGADDAAAAAQRAAQGLLLGLGLLLAVLSRTGNKGEFEATGAGGGGGVDQSSVQTRGLIGGDTSIAIAEINNGLQEALIPTNAILNQIELNTRGLLGIEGGQINLEAIIANQVNSIFEESLLQNA